MLARAIRTLLMRLLLSDSLKTVETLAEANALAARAVGLRLSSTHEVPKPNLTEAKWNAERIGPTIMARPVFANG
jgi:hypothetical protein